MEAITLTPQRRLDSQDERAPNGIRAIFYLPLSLPPLLLRLMSGVCLLVPPLHSATATTPSTRMDLDEARETVGRRRRTSAAQAKCFL